MIKQYRYFGEIATNSENKEDETVVIEEEVNANLLTNVTVEDLMSGAAFSEEDGSGPIGKEIISIGIQAVPGTRVVLSSEKFSEGETVLNTTKPVLVIGASNFYQVNFALMDLKFTLGSLAIEVFKNKEYNATTGIIIDIAYKIPEGQGY